MAVMLQKLGCPDRRRLAAPGRSSTVKAVAYDGRALPLVVPAASSCDELALAAAWRQQENGGRNNLRHRVAGTLAGRTAATIATNDTVVASRPGKSAMAVDAACIGDTVARHLLSEGAYAMAAVDDAPEVDLLVLDQINLQPVANFTDSSFVVTWTQINHNLI